MCTGVQTFGRMKIKIEKKTYGKLERREEKGERREINKNNENMMNDKTVV